MEVLSAGAGLWKFCLLQFVEVMPLEVLSVGAGNGQTVDQPGSSSLQEGMSAVWQEAGVPRLWETPGL